MMTGTTPSTAPRHLPALVSDFKDKLSPGRDRKIAMRPTLLIAAAALMLGFSCNATLADDTLSPSELRQLFPGSFDAVVYGLLEVKIIARGDGQLIGVFSGRKDTGRWSVSNGRLCIMLKSWTDGKSSCSEVFVSNGWYRGNGVRFKKL